MTKTAVTKPIEKMNRDELRDTARRLGLTRISRLRKAELFSCVQEALHTKGETSSREPSSVIFSANATATSATRIKHSVEKKSRAVSPIIVDTKALQEVDRFTPEPTSTQETDRIALMLKDRKELYCYWYVSAAYRRSAQEAGGKQFELRLFQENSPDAGSLPISTIALADTEHHRFMTAPPEPGHYFVEVGYRGDTRWFPLMRSNIVSLDSGERKPVSPKSPSIIRLVTMPYSQPLPVEPATTRSMELTVSNLVPSTNKAPSSTEKDQEEPSVESLPSSPHEGWFSHNLS